MNIDFGLKKEVFFKECLYKKPYLFKKAISDIDMAWSDVNEIYERADASDRTFKLMNGYEVPKREYLESYMNVGRLEYRYVKPVIYDYMRNGATLVYNRIKNEPKISHLVHQIANYAGAQTITSGYAAFSSKSSYKSHWDTRDVFAVQLFGRKRWILKTPSFDLPLYMQQAKDMPYIDEPEEVYMDIVIEPGDILYIPRGWWHNPIPVGEETFHLAVGTFAPTGFDFLKWLMNFMPEIEACRKNFHNYENDKESLIAIKNSISDSLDDKSVYESFMCDYLGQQRVDSKLSLDVLGNSDVRVLSESQKIKVNANTLPFFSEGFVVINGNRINIDSVSGDLIKSVFDKGLCTVADVAESFDGNSKRKVNALLFELGINDVIELVG